MKKIQKLKNINTNSKEENSSYKKNKKNSDFYPDFFKTVDTAKNEKKHKLEDFDGLDEIRKEYENALNDYGDVNAENDEPDNAEAIAKQLVLDKDILQIYDQMEDLVDSPKKSIPAMLETIKNARKKETEELEEEKKKEQIKEAVQRKQSAMKGKLSALTGFFKISKFCFHFIFFSKNQTQPFH